MPILITHQQSPYLDSLSNLLQRQHNTNSDSGTLGNIRDKRTDTYIHTHTYMHTTYLYIYKYI